MMEGRDRREAFGTWQGVGQSKLGLLEGWFVGRVVGWKGGYVDGYATVQMSREKGGLGARTEA